MTQRVNLRLLLKIDAESEVHRLCTGARKYQLDPDEIDTEGGIYTGLGNWAGELPVLDQLANGELQILPLTVSGPMSTDLVAAMRNNRTEIRGARACLGVLRLDERYRRPADEEVWWFEGVCGALSIARVSGGPGQWIRSVTLNVHFGDVDRKRPKLARWTHLDQQERYPGDTGLSRMPLYNLGTTRGPWPEPT